MYHLPLPSFHEDAENPGMPLNEIGERTILRFPSVSMIALASINCNLYRELRAVKNYDAYIPFI